MVTTRPSWRDQPDRVAELQKAPIAIEAVQKIDELFAIEREINGLPEEQRWTALFA